MAQITQVDIYWAGPGWYVWLVVEEGEDKARHEYRFMAPLSHRINELQEKLKEYERPPYFLAPKVKRWRERPAAGGVTTVHDA